MRVDVHAHYYDAELLNATAPLGGDFSAVAAAAPCSGLSLAERFDLMDQAGIEVQVISPGGLQPYTENRDLATSSARLINDAYAGQVSRHAGRLAFFGCVPLPHVEGAIVEAARCLDDLGAAGINLGCSVLDGPLDNPAFEPLWAELHRRRAVVFLHPLGTVRPMMGEFGLAWAIGGRFEDTVAAGRLASAGVVHRYPDLRIIVPHLGGAIPFLWDRFRDRPAADGRTYDVKEGLARMYYDSINLAPGMLCAACGIVTPGHVLLGTDFPWTPGDLTRFVRHVEDSGLPPMDAAAILDANAAQLLGLNS
ncbi:MAG: amidohydrolase [Chloroflexi bacterium]|nr:amidohydrolase [Chloroflexota bacterium]